MDFSSPDLRRQYEGLLDRSPGSLAFAPLARIYHLRGRKELAERLCMEGLRRNPRHSEGYIVLAQIQKDKGCPREALKSLSLAREYDFENPLIYELMGEIYRDLSDLPRALKAFEFALRLKPFSRFARAMVEELRRAPVKGGAFFKESLFAAPPPAHRPSAKLKKLYALLLKVERKMGDL